MVSIKKISCKSIIPRLSDFNGIIVSMVLLILFQMYVISSDFIKQLVLGCSNRKSLAAFKRDSI
jgi:hypothetical protein